MKKLVKRIASMVLALSMVMVPVTPTEAATKKRNTPMWKQEDMAYDFTAKWLPKTCPSYLLSYATYEIMDINKDRNVDLIWAYPAGQYTALKVFTYRRGKGMVRSIKPIYGLYGYKVDKARKSIIAFGGQNNFDYSTGFGYHLSFYYIYKFKGTQLKRTERWQMKEYNGGRTRYYKNGKRVSEARYKATETRYDAL